MKFQSRQETERTSSTFTSANALPSSLARNRREPLRGKVVRVEGTAARVISGVNGPDDYLSAHPAIPNGASRGSRQKTVENGGVVDQGV